MHPDRALVIVPTYNERDNMSVLLDSLLASSLCLDVLVVDDGSPDGTADLVDEHSGSSGRCVVMRRRGKRGLGRSYVDGYRWALDAGYPRVVQMDADLSHNPDYIPALLSASQEADVVLGSRYCRGGGVRDWPWRRVLLSRFANLYVGAVAGLPVRDATSGFRCYTRGALERIQIDRVASNGYAFQVEMTYRAQQAGLLLAECPIVFTDRRAGRSKISRAVLVESMVVPWRLRLGLSAVPARPSPERPAA